MSEAGIRRGRVRIQLGGQPAPQVTVHQGRVHTQQAALTSLAAQAGPCAIRRVFGCVVFNQVPISAIGAVVEGVDRGDLLWRRLYQPFRASGTAV